MAYRFTRKADADIVDIYLYGAQDFGTEEAERYSDGLITAFERLAVAPFLMRERTEFNPTLRLYLYPSHLIAYLVEEDGGILILRILHGHQD